MPRQPGRIVEVPLVELGDIETLDDFRTAVHDRRHEVGRAVVDAFHHIGFVYIRAPQEFRDKLYSMYEACERLFALSDEELAPYDGQFFNFQRGHTPVDRELSPFCKAVNVEGEVLPRSIPNHAQNWFVGPEGLQNSLLQPQYEDDYIANIWPSQVPDLKDATIPVYNELRLMSDDIMETTESRLWLPNGFFRETSHDSPTLMRMLNYRPVCEICYESGAVEGACQHTDINRETTLPEPYRKNNQSTGKGLEAKTRWGQWTPIRTPKDCFTMQVGDMLQRESGHYFVSAQHRVPPPLIQRGEVNRISAAMFKHPTATFDLETWDLSHLTSKQKKLEKKNSHLYLHERLGLIGLENEDSTTGKQKMRHTRKDDLQEPPRPYDCPHGVAA